MPHTYFITNNAASLLQAAPNKTILKHIGCTLAFKFSTEKWANTKNFEHRKNLEQGEEIPHCPLKSRTHRFGTHEKFSQFTTLKN